MRPIIAITLLVATTLAAVPTEAASRPIADFFGTFVGRSISVVGEGLSQRDLNVIIKKHMKSGFTVDWTTVTRRADGSTKSKQYSINFMPTKRTGIYASAMRNNVFGGKVPLDPLKGDPYVWAGIDGDTLTVHALMILDDGGYEMQIFERTLTADGMVLKFSRNRDGVLARSVTGRLKKTAD